MTTRLVPAPLTGWINAAVAQVGCSWVAQLAIGWGLLPPSSLHLFQPRNSDIEQTVVGQSSQTDLLTTQQLWSCNKAITGTHAPIIVTHTLIKTTWSYFFALPLQQEQRQMMYVLGSHDDDLVIFLSWPSIYQLEVMGKSSVSQLKFWLLAWWHIAIALWEYGDRNFSFLEESW